MCGIAGGINLPNSITDLLLLDSLSHRGPDNQGSFAVGPFLVTHTLLKIRDSASGRTQPFLVDNRWLLAMNGEIYSIDDAVLNSQLGTKSNHEADAICSSFSSFGLEALNKFSGMFSFSVIDQLNKTVTLARDGSGQKPLYYSLGENKSLLWASELTTFVRSKFVPTRLNSSYLAQNLGIGFASSQDTLIKGVFQIPHGSWVTFDSNGEIVGSGRIKNQAKAILMGDLNYNLAQTLESHFVADVQCALSLSGGLDSATIAGFAHSKRIQLSTFSTRFAKCPEGSNWDFFRAEKLSREFNFDFTEVLITPELYLENFTQAHQLLDEPLFNQSLPVYLELIKQVKLKDSNLRVLLSGAGGDELFAGYPHHRKFWLQKRILGLIGEKMFRNLYTLKNRNDPILEADEFWHRVRRLRWPVNVALIDFEDSLPFNEINFNSLDTRELARIIEMDQAWLRADNFQYLDRFGMNNELECRAPFANVELFDWVWSETNPSLNFGLLGGFNQKRQLQKFSREYLPDWFFRDLEKRGWAAPIRYWYENAPDFRDFFIELFAQFESSNSSLPIDFKLVNKILKKSVKFPGKWLIYLSSTAIVTEKLELR
jgi:asparagine synthase (glutamine-hydrolysing)